MNQDDRTIQIRKYVQFLYGDREGYFSVNFPETFYNDYNNNRVKLVTYLADRCNKDTWISVNTFKNAKRDKDDAQDIRFFLCEYDFGEAGHRNDNQPFETYEATITNVTKAFEEANIKPSMIISSGHGIHCYWKIDTNVAGKYDNEQYKNINESIFQIGLKYAASGEFHNETKDIARIMRVPGTDNCKHIEDIKICQIVFPSVDTKLADYKIYNLFDILQVVNEFDSKNKKNETKNDIDQIKKIIGKNSKPKNKNKLAIDIDDDTSIENEEVYDDEISFKVITDVNMDSPEFLEWCAQDGVSSLKNITNPWSGKVYDSSSEMQQFILGVLTLNGLNTEEILEFFEDNCNPNINILRKASKRDKLRAIETRVNGLLENGYLPKHEKKLLYNGKEYDVDFIILDKNDRPSLHSLLFNNFVGKYFYEIIENDIENFKYGGYRFWDETRKWWVPYNSNKHILNEFLNKKMEKITEIVYPKGLVLSPKLTKDMADTIERKMTSTATKKELAKDVNESGISIAFKNGTLYINKKAQKVITRFEKNEFKKENYCLYRINLDFEDWMLCNKAWEKSTLGDYLLTFFNDDDRDLLQRFLGMILVPEVFAKYCLLLYGKEGNNGKTTIMNMIRELFDENKRCCTSLKIEKWHEEHVNVNFVYSIFNISDESSENRYAESDVFKEFLGGNTIQINPKFLAPYDINPFFKNVITANKMPNLTVEPAILKRLCMINIEKSINDAGEWHKKVTKDSDYLMCFVLNGLIKQYSESFPILQTHDKMLETFMKTENDTTIRFFEEKITVTKDPKDSIPMDSLYAEYKSWMDANNPSGKKINDKAFKEKFRDHYKQYIDNNDIQLNVPTRIKMPGHSDSKVIKCIRGIKVDSMFDGWTF